MRQSPMPTYQEHNAVELRKLKDKREVHLAKLRKQTDACNVWSRILTIPIAILAVYLVGVASLVFRLHSLPNSSHPSTLVSPLHRAAAQKHVSSSTAVITNSSTTRIVNATNLSSVSLSESKAGAPTRIPTAAPSLAPTPKKEFVDVLRSDETTLNLPSLHDEPESVLHLARSTFKIPLKHARVESLSQLLSHSLLRGNTTASLDASKRNIIVGMATNIDARYLTIFVKSARNAAPNAEIFLFFESKALDTMIWNILAKSRIHVVEYFATHLEPPFLRNYHPSSIRWIFYHRFFSFQGSLFASRFDRVIATDVRDVHFSSDPFKHLMHAPINKEMVRPIHHISRVGNSLVFEKSYEDGFNSWKNTTVIEWKTGLPLSTVVNQLPEPPRRAHVNPGARVYAFKEEDSPSLEACGWNAGWVRDCFGQWTLDALSGSAISCSGVVLGSMTGSLSYLQVMADVLLGRSTVTDRFPYCERNGVDQGVHNVLVHAGLVPGLGLHTTLTYPGVLTHMQSDLYVIADLKAALPTVNNKAGVEVAIVHQYDRIAEIQRKYAAAYVDWMDVSDWHAGWALESSGCGAYKRLVEYDLLKGACDFGSLRSLQPDMCCSTCAKKPGCTAFTFAGGVCWLKRCTKPEIASAYLNFTIHHALHLPTHQYVAVADESNTPLGTLVVSGMLDEAIRGWKQSFDIQSTMESIMRRYGLTGKAFQIGQGALTSDIQTLKRDFDLFLPEFEKTLALKDVSAT